MKKINAIGQYLVGESFVWKKNTWRFRARAPLDTAPSNKSFIRKIARSRAKRFFLNKIEFFFQKNGHFVKKIVHGNSISF